MSPAEEKSLLGRCGAGDPDAWDAFFDEHQGAVGRFLFQVMPDGTTEDVEEVCQDTFLAAIRGVRSFNGRSRVQTWLFRIAANKARDFRDHRLAVKRGGGHAILSLDREDPTSGRKPDAPATSRTPDEALLTTEAMAEVRRALDQLDTRCREILELRYFGDLDYASIGSLLHLNSKTVSSRLSRCLDRLGGLLADERQTEEHRRESV
jgi:RNA polymerase sigma-70 factor (ECF subfamily)